MNSNPNTPVAGLVERLLKDLDDEISALNAAHEAMQAINENTEAYELHLKLEGLERAREIMFPHIEQLEADKRALVEPWDWLAENVGIELSWGELDDPSECAWQVHRVNGGRNDREWTLIATGETPLEAVTKARATISNPSPVKGTE